MSIQINFGREFEARVYARAEELQAQGLDEGTLDDKTFGQLTVYIDRKPRSVLYSATGVDGPLKGHSIYCGADDE